MPTQEPPEVSDPNSFMCACGENLRQACAGEKFYKEKEGERYCVLHYPGDEKEEDFKKALNQKQSRRDYNFRGVWFPKGVRFKQLHWDGNTDFSSATFNEDTDFTGVEFSVKALFNNASFNAGVDFSRGAFSADADFKGACFGKGACFNNTDFRNSADFRSARFSEVADFSSVGFNADAKFSYAEFNAGAKFSSARFRADAHFGSASFSEQAFFSYASFSQVADFGAARFNKIASFHYADFSAKANFSFAGFSADGDFSSARFRAGAHFGSARFSRIADFRSARFSEAADFRSARFNEVADFRWVIFKDYFYFAGEPKKRTFGDQQQLNFQFTHFEKPDRVSFHTLDLKPHWFVNVDSRKFEFIDVEFRFVLNEELRRLNNANASAPHRLLAIACRQLADNAEANHRYGEASRLRYSASEARRIERFYGFVFWRLDWWYWLASGYGESVLKAFIVFVALIGLFTVGYKNSEFDPTSKTAIAKPTPTAANSSPGYPDIQPRRLGWRESALYSFNVSILQKPEPRPIGLWGNALASLQTVLGPAQAALLALALRRRFMR
jgi:hypothetical protein